MARNRIQEAVQLAWQNANAAQGALGQQNGAALANMYSNLAQTWCQVAQLLIQVAELGAGDFDTGGSGS